LSKAEHEDSRDLHWTLVTEGEEQGSLIESFHDLGGLELGGQGSNWRLGEERSNCRVSGRATGDEHD
jgi:hypothetical protein